MIRASVVHGMWFAFFIAAFAATIAAFFASLAAGLVVYGLLDGAGTWTALVGGALAMLLCTSLTLGVLAAALERAE